MTSPYLLCAASCAVALLAAGIGYRRPVARARRAQRRQIRALDQQRRDLEARVADEWRRIHGQLAVRDAEALMLRLLADHPELHPLQARTRRSVR
jgi:hypothetical protein